MNTRKEAPKQTAAATGLSDIVRGFQVVRSGDRTGRARLSETAGSRDFASSI